MSLDINPAKTALVLIDIQRGIMGMPLAPHDASTVVKNSIALGKRLKQTGGTIVLVHVAFSNNTVDKLAQPVDAPSNPPPGGYPADWAEFLPEVAALKPDVTITKRQWGAFHGTELDLQLRRRGLTTIILGGVATNFGVESTAREAWQHNYSVIVAEDACSSASAEIHQFAIKSIFPRIARVRSTEEILSAVSK